MKNFQEFVIDPVKSMILTLFKRRSGHLRMLLFLQIFAYGLLWFNYQLVEMEYVYMLKRFKSFQENPSQYAYYSAIKYR